MERACEKYNAYVQILKEELIPAMGCTEPIAVAYASAVARDVLGELPDHVEVYASGSIIKNVKSVIVPNTDQMKGVGSAAAAGIIAGDAKRELEVIASVTREQINEMHKFVEVVPIEVNYLDLGLVFDLIVVLHAGEHVSKVRIANYHTNIVHIEKDGEVLKDIPVVDEAEEGLTDRSALNMRDILDFANTVAIEDVEHVLSTQISCNIAIAEEGMKNDYGSCVGKTLIEMNGNDIRTRARAFAAAGSDARMNGCEMPVVVNSGSGNQGITASVPVIVYAKEMGVSEEKLLRALVLSNLVAIHQKTGIGRLSGYCGAVCAGAASGAGIAYLHDAEYEVIEGTVVNAVASVSGIICDGAKASCAAKIAESVDAGIIGYYMAKKGRIFNEGDGIVNTTAEDTLRNVGRLAKEGMKTTNDVIIDMMIRC